MDEPKDPAAMSDEELRDASGATPPEEPTKPEEPSPPSEPPKTDPPAPAGDEPPEDAPKDPTPPADPPQDPPKDEPKPPSRRESLRVQKLLERYGPPPERKPDQSAPSNRPDFRKKFTTDDEGLYEDLDKETEEFGKAERQAGTTEALKQMETVEWRTNLRIDNQAVESKFEVLNKNSDNFNSLLADAMNKRYLAMVGFDPQTGLVSNPKISYLDFIEAEFELADEIATTRGAESAKNLEDQSNNTGLRPSGTAAKPMDLSKHPQDMTNEELEAAVAASMPRDRRGRFTSR